MGKYSFFTLDKDVPVAPILKTIFSILDNFGCKDISYNTLFFLIFYDDFSFMFISLLQCATDCVSAARITPFNVFFYNC